MFQKLDGWRERPLLRCLHAVSVARDKNPFVLFGGDVKRTAAGAIGRRSRVDVIRRTFGLKALAEECRPYGAGRFQWELTQHSAFGCVLGFDISCLRHSGS
jgi:hypothetical protein